MTKGFLGKWKWVIIIVLVLSVGGAAYGWVLFLMPNTAFEEKSRIVFVPVAIGVEEWLKTEGEFLIGDESSFLRAASIKKFRTTKPGRYRLKKGMTNNAIINMLRSGNQEAVNLRIDDVQTIYDLAGRLGKNMRSDSTAFISLFTDQEETREYGFNTYTLPCMILPNTYDFFWTMEPKDFLVRMKKIYDNYWTEEKKKQAAAIGMTPTQVGILASIVKAETGKRDEAPQIAGLYMNRLNMGMPLQSDPTAVFGNKVHSQRVYLSDLGNDSPYNTYRINGLPPGPINLAETSYLDAVLNYAHHSYIYMCAQPGATGYHNFSRTLEQHNVYRNEYVKWLEKKGVR